MLPFSYRHYPLAAYRIKASFPDNNRYYYYPSEGSEGVSTSHGDGSDLLHRHHVNHRPPLPKGRLVFTYRNPIVRACSRLQKKCPSKRQQLELGRTFTPGYEPSRLGESGRRLQGVVVGAKGRKGFSSSSSSFPLTFEIPSQPFSLPESVLILTL